jgi:ornithine--oxo-acid transaminase
VGTYNLEPFQTTGGSEAVESAVKFAHAATGRGKIVYCSNGFHGLTMGALSLNGSEVFRKGFEPLLPDCVQVPFNDLPALEAALRSNDVAGFFVEPIQGKGVYMPADDYLPQALALCRKYGTLFIADEIQTGMGRTGKFLACEHWGVDPDMVLLSKSLSGGFVPVGALLTKQWIFSKLFDRMDRAMVHGSTFSKNDLGMAAALATLSVIEDEKLVARAATLGDAILGDFRAFRDKYELVKDVRGKGLMIGIEFGAPDSFALKASWSVLETASKGLFCQLITVPLFKEHKILSQVSGHGSHTIKLIPALTLTDADCDWIVNAFDAVIAASHRVPGAAWSLGKTLVGHAMRART